METLHTPPEPQSLVDLIIRNASLYPKKLAYAFLKNSNDIERSISYGELLSQCQNFQSNVRLLGLQGQIILIMQPGIEFIEAFYGCVYSGLHPVPIHKPRNSGSAFQRIKSIITDSQSSFIITSTNYFNSVTSWANSLEFGDGLKILAFDQLLQSRGTEDREPVKFPSAKDLCFLQYTSGSTSSPKGVMVSHGNLIHNASVTKNLLQHTEKSIIVSWLPLFHDLGLIGNVIQCLYTGASCYLMAPQSFVSNPLRWLEAVSKFRANTIMAPNFAFDLCIRKIDWEDKLALDLSTLKSVLNGAEPIRDKTLRHFQLQFADCGLQNSALLPAYGLAEATLIASAKPAGDQPFTIRVDNDALENHEVKLSDDGRVLVSSGEGVCDQLLTIVNPDTGAELGEGKVGEIWIKGPSVCQGYWNKPQETKETFGAYIGDTGPFLRTGDLGFKYNGQIFISSRMKDLIIIRGRNLYPQDIEFLAETNCQDIRANHTSAFSIERGNDEILIFVAELTKSAYLDKNISMPQIEDKIKSSIFFEMDIEVRDVVLLKPKTLPKTSSGKLQRQQCKQMYLNNTLERATR